MHYYERLTAQPSLAATLHDRSLDRTLVRVRLVHLPTSMRDKDRDKDRPPLTVRVRTHERVWTSARRADISEVNITSHITPRITLHITSQHTHIDSTSSRPFTP